MKDQNIKEEYFYDIEYFGPLLGEQHSMGGWGFNIVLDGTFAVKLASLPLQDHVKERLNKLTNPIVRKLWNCPKESEKDWDMYDCEPKFNFWDDTMLLTNVSVPGNACGLDAEHYDFSMVIKGEKPLGGFRYGPHNVDGMGQASMLLIAWLKWFEMAYYLTLEKK